MMTTGESKTFEQFYQTNSLLVELNRVVLRFAQRCPPDGAKGVIASKYARQLNEEITQYRPDLETTSCGGFNFLKIHWHFVPSVERFAPFTEYAVLDDIPTTISEGV